MWRSFLLALGLMLGGGAISLALDVADMTVEWTPEGKELAVERAKRPVNDEMVRIPAGWFLMGSSRKTDKNASIAEIPQRRIHLDAYEIGKYEVTALEYLRFVLATDRPPLIDWRYDGGNFQEAMAHHPVMHVSWYDADEYCHWSDKRLPTEAEWEKAARGEDGRIYPWGNQSAGLTRSNFGRPGLSGPVRDRPERLMLYPPVISVDKYDNGVSPYGVYQMAGNVAEWVADWYEAKYYVVMPERNPKGPEHGTQKSFRGGGWIDSTPAVRAAARNGADPHMKMNWLGFRCARDVQDAGTPDSSTGGASTSQSGPHESSS